MTNFVELKSANAVLDVEDRMLYELDGFGGIPIMGSGFPIDEMDEEWFDELTLEENELLMVVL